MPALELSSIAQKLHDFTPELWSTAGGVGGDAERPPASRRPPRLPDLKRDAKDHGRLFRRQSGISAYVGQNGSGKSAAMIFDSLPTLRGIIWRCSEPTHLHMHPDYVDPRTGVVGPVMTGLRRIISTVDVLDSETGELHPLFTKLSAANGGWRLVLDAEHCDILFDEVTGIAGSRQSQGMPVAVQTVLDKLRKKDVLLRWTAPAWSRADTTIRTVTNTVTLCRGYLPDVRKTRSMAEPPAWVPARLFKLRTFDARDMDEFTAANSSGDRRGSDRPSALKAKTHWLWGPGSEFFASYDTYSAVSRVAEYLDGGRCADCGGSVAVPKCACAH